MHILLDTNILISFISDPNEEYLIDKLRELIDSSQVKLLVPDILMKEWEKKKEEAIQKKKALHKQVEETSHNKNLNTELKSELSIIEDKIDRTEALLMKGIHIKLLNKVKILATDRRTENLPPFKSGNKTSFNDGLIFFSAVGYLKKNKIKEYCFITKDKDFSDEGKKNQINPSLQQSGIDVYYGPSLEKILRDIKASGKIQEESKSEKSNRGTILWIL